MKVLAKGERLPAHKYRVFSHTTGDTEVYHLLDKDENLVATLYKSRWHFSPRKIQLA